MNIYYYKEFHLPMLKIYREITKGIWICLAISGAILLFASRYIRGGWGALILNIIIFCVVYGITLLVFGLNDKEKSSLPIINKIFMKKEKEI